MTNLTKLGWIIVVIIIAVGLAVKVGAAPAPKVFVCKYVGTPGVDERLQTGNNPISVSQNAIQNFQGVGSYFNDAQGRSFVLAFDTGQPEPDVSECPAPAPNNPVTPDTPKDPDVNLTDEQRQVLVDQLEGQK